MNNGIKNLNNNKSSIDNLTFNTFSEKVAFRGGSGPNQNINLSNGNIQTYTLTSNCVFNMPPVIAGKSFTVILSTGSGNYTATFTGVKWADNIPPSVTITPSKSDIFNFISDGNYWYGSFSQNYNTSSNHVEVNNWLNAIYWNGGSASSTTVAALNTFCNAIDNAGIRSKISRLNLLCGNNLQSCFTPLYAGQNPSSVGDGQSFLDTGYNFVSTDYNETGTSGGLKGNGLSFASGGKYLKPNINTSGQTGNESVGVYVAEEATVANPTGTYYLIGSHSPSNQNRSLGIAYYNSQYYIEDGTLGISPNGTWATSLSQAVGFRSVSSNGLSSRKMYLNGNVVFANTDTTTASVNPIPPYLFTRSDSGNTYGYGNQRISCYFIGISMSDSNMLSLYNAIQAFQTSLGRNV